MSDLISRQAALDRINKLIEVEKKQGTDDWGYGRERVNAYEAMLHMVKNEYLYPSVELERKKGKWIEKEGYDGDVYYDCSVCGNSWTTIDGTPWDNGMNYCPKCGARMEVDNG